MLNAMNYSEDQLDENAKRRRELFGRYGLAMYHAQCVEKSLAILTSCVFHKEFLKSSIEIREEIQSQSFTKVPGHLIRKLESQVTIPQNLNNNLLEALRKRNWLAHDYFYDRAQDLLTPDGNKKIIEELTSLYKFFSELDLHLMSIVDKWSSKVGIEKSIENEIKEMKKKLRSI